jgi:pimeloyl-ACP methyl ester carboxylesterase
MATFVLVHGGWSGAHGWRTVRRQLAAGGHEVFTPSLTGLGERVHLASPLVDLTTHVHDVVNQILVGYSYGGAVVTAALPHVHKRIRELIYLDAFVPADGDSVSRLSGRDRSTKIELGDEWLVPPPERHYDDPREATWQNARRVRHPVRCFTEPIEITKPVEQYDFGLTYVKAATDGRDVPGGDAFWDAAEHARASNRWRYREIDTNHMVASNRPSELATLLVELSD